MGVHARIGLLNRVEIEDEIERLIALLDTADAPTEDFEPDDDQCLAGDDGCGFVLLGEYRGWGSHIETDNQLPPPVYGIDQDTPPANYETAQREWHARQMGLVRTATGWRWPN